MKHLINSSKSLVAGLLVIGVSLLCACSGDSGGSDKVVPQTFGVVTLSNVGSIGILDGQTQTLASVKLTGELGSYSGGPYDVAITPDGKTTLVSNFDDKKVYFINTANPAAPEVLGSVTLSFSPLDIAITPDGRYALVTDGGSPKIGVINIADRTIASTFENPSDSLMAVAVARDGKTVLTVNYSGRKVNVLTLRADGHLTFVNTLDVSVPVWDDDAKVYVPTLRPVNIEISPDGQTAIVVGVALWKDAARKTPADLAFPVLKISSPGVVTLNQIPTWENLEGAQSVAFNRTGTQAYVMCVQPLPDPLPPVPVYPKGVIKALNINGSGLVSDAGVSVEVNIYGRNQLFGVETLAMDNVGRYLYVSNPTLSGAGNYIEIVDTTTNTPVKQIPFANIDAPTSTAPLPTGITFWQIPAVFLGR